MGECQSACNSDQPTKTIMEQSIRVEYDGESFVMPEKLTFERQTTINKVEQAAIAFCQKNDIELLYAPMLARIIAFRNEFIFHEVWKRLPVSDRQEFLDDLNDINHDLMDSFYHHLIKRLSLRESTVKQPPKIGVPKYTRDSEISEGEMRVLRSTGQQLLREGKVAAIFMCAGSSSRFEDGDKFLYSLNKLNGSCLLDLAFRRLRKNVGDMGDKDGKINLPIIVNCNQFNLQKVQSFLVQRKFYGFDRKKFKFFITYSLAIFNSNGKYCLNQRLMPMKRPSGTASSIEYLLDKDMAKFLTSQRVQYVFTSGLQNLLENPCDPILLGLMKTKGRTVGAKCVGEMFHREQLPRYFLNQNTGRIEMLNIEQLETVEPTKLLQRLPIATNSMVFELSSLFRLISDYNTSLFLAQKYHIIQKEETVYNFRLYRTEKRQCYSFQKDLRDVISCVEDPLLYKVKRQTTYAPIMTRNMGYALNDAVAYYYQRIQKELEENTVPS